MKDNPKMRKNQEKITTPFNCTSRFFIHDETLTTAEKIKESITPTSKDKRPITIIIFPMFGVPALTYGIKLLD